MQEIAADDNGHVYVTGDAKSTDFPTQNPYMTDPGDGADDVFITKFSFQNTFTLTSPDGGENWKLSSIQDITWNTVGISGLLKITLWKNGILVGTIANNIAPATGSYAWTVGKLSNGSMVAPGADYTIKIKETGTAIADSSDATFQLIL